MLGVKLGTITPEGTAGKYSCHAWFISSAEQADIYCYACDDAKLDPDLATHLHNVGIAVLDQSKTEKSMTELVSEELRCKQCPA